MRASTADRPGPTRIPNATYRVQLSAAFTMRDLTATIPYLADLGISHVYCSPYFRARPGSTHGYDVVDHNTLNPEIGTRADLERFVAALRARGMGHILDVVPNHVGVMGAQNVWWMDVLEHGQASGYADYFDIDWQPPNPWLTGKLLVPVLGDSYGETLERGELRLRFERDAGSFAVHYHQHRFPIDPRSYPRILERALVIVGMDTPDPPARAELERLIGELRGLPGRDAAERSVAGGRGAVAATCKSRLAAFVAANAQHERAIDAAVASFVGHAGEPATFDSLHELLELQAYRLASWRVASDDVNYRRFFDVNDLAALRIENRDVFDATSELTRALVRDGLVDGLRIDHPDGLYDPAEYFQRLRQAMPRPESDADRGENRTAAPLYVVIEKIAAAFERLPSQWLVHGTTGYRFANLVNGLFIDARSKGTIDRTYRAFVGESLDWTEVAYESKSLVLRTSLSSELNVLANHIARIAAADRRTRQFTLNSLRTGLTEVIARFPVYRTYVAARIADEDRRYIDWAIARVCRRSAAANGALYDFLRAALVGDTGVFGEPLPEAVRSFAMKFQQVTAPVAAKGVEDTGFYRYTRLASLNEVGGDPDTFGTTVRKFHAECRHRRRNWPHEMLTTSTHDTKRSEDVRARIDVLTEWPSRWRRALHRWSRLNRGRRRIVDGLPAPGPHAEYLLYQTLLGTWPDGPRDAAAYAAYTERIVGYMIKAMREAKRRTSWLNVNAEYEEALGAFIRSVLECRDGNPFYAELDQFARLLADPGRLNSLSATLCKLTAPGVPDIYQGNELWDLSLVDPDNRRPVDYASRRRLLSTLAAGGEPPDAASATALLGSLQDGRAKLLLTWRALRFRGTHAALFREGAYVPLRTRGERRLQICAFARRHGRQLALTIVPRLCARLIAERGSMPLGVGAWGDTTIELPPNGPANRFVDALTGATVPAPTSGRGALRAADVFAHFPVALLSGHAPQGLSAPVRSTDATL
jgi:malto-oligosyltrehalose synthase